MKTEDKYEALTQIFLRLKNAVNEKYITLTGKRSLLICKAL